MKQKQIQTTSEALIAAEKAIDGASRHGAALGLAHNTAAAIAADRDALLAKRAIREEARGAMQQARRSRDGKFDDVRQFVVLTRDLLKRHLGSQHNERWLSVGFSRSLMVPRTPDKLLVLLGNVAEFLAQHPSFGHPALSITAEHATLLHGELLALQHEVKGQDVIERGAVLARDGALVLVRRRISNLAKELSQVLSRLDPRWIDFGLNQPGAVSAPDRPREVNAVRISQTPAVRVQWKRSPRAAYYRVWQRVLTKDEVLTAVGKTDGVDFVIDDIPANLEAEVVVTAVNSAGESLRSEVVKVRPSLS